MLKHCTQMFPCVERFLILFLKNKKNNPDDKLIDSTTTLSFVHNYLYMELNPIHCGPSTIFSPIPKYKYVTSLKHTGVYAAYMWIFCPYRKSRLIFSFILAVSISSSSLPLKSILFIIVTTPLK